MMINTQKPMAPDRATDHSLVVHSWFHTIQGEGPFAGRAAFFIRLAGCNLQCPQCDTEYTQGARRMSLTELERLLLKEIQDEEVLVITGGEPFRQRITPLLFLASMVVYGSIQIETNGVLYPGDDFPWGHNKIKVVCSPKTGRIHQETAHKVDAYKYVLKHDDVADDGLPIHALDHPLGNFDRVARPPLGWYGPIFLQPMDAKDPDENRLNMEAVVKSVMQHKKYIMGVQMHKLVDLP